MSLLQTIKDAQLQARKNRQADAAASLTTLIGEASSIGKNDGNRETTDAEIVTVVKKFIKNINETLAALPPTDARVQAFSAEKVLYEGFLPTQISNDQLKVIIVQLTDELNAHTIRDMGKVMKALKDRYDGQYDGAAASGLIKAALS